MLLWTQLTDRLALIAFYSVTFVLRIILESIDLYLGVCSIMLEYTTYIPRLAAGSVVPKQHSWGILFSHDLVRYLCSRENFRPEICKINRADNPLIQDDEAHHAHQRSTAWFCPHNSDTEFPKPITTLRDSEDDFELTGYVCMYASMRAVQDTVIRLIRCCD